MEPAQHTEHQCLRVTPAESTSGPKQPQAIEVICLNPDDETVQIGESAIPVTSTEFRILRTLVVQPAIVVRRTALLGVLSRDQTLAASRCLDVHISHLRTKLRACGIAIRTVRGIGYRVTPFVNLPTPDTSPKLTPTDNS